MKMYLIGLQIILGITVLLEANFFEKDTNFGVGLFNAIVSLDVIEPMACYIFAICCNKKE